MSISKNQNLHLFNKIFDIISNLEEIHLFRKEDRYRNEMDKYLWTRLSLSCLLKFIVAGTIDEITAAFKKLVSSLQNKLAILFAERYLPHAESQHN